MTEKSEIVPDELSIEYSDNGSFSSFSGNVVQGISQIENIDRKFAEEVVAKIAEAFEGGSYYAIAAGRIYDRKGYATTDKIGSTRNASYSSDSDDVLLQITVALNIGQAQGIVDEITERKHRVELTEIAEKRSALERQLSELASRESNLRS